MKDLINSIPDKEKHTMSFDDLEDIENETVVAEYDEDKDKIIQANFVGDEGMDNTVKTALRRNRGVMILED